MTDPQRDRMLEDLLYISRKLLAASNADTSSGQLSIKSPQQIHRRYLESVLNALTKIQPSMARIDRQPRFELHRRICPLNRNKLKKFDANVFRQCFANPARQKFRAVDFERSTDIYEHRLLLYLFNRLKKMTSESDARFAEQSFMLEQKILDSKQNILQSKHKSNWSEYTASLNSRLKQLRLTARAKFKDDLLRSKTFDQRADHKGGLGIRGSTPEMRIDFSSQHGLLCSFVGTNVALVICNQKQISAALRLNELLKSGGEIGIFGGWRNCGDMVLFADVLTINGNPIEILDSDREDFFDLYFRSTTAQNSAWTELGVMTSFKYKSLPFQFDERRELLAAIDLQLEHILQLKLFDGISEREHEQRLTQIFSNDPNYHRVYFALRELDGLYDFAFGFDGETILLEHWWRLYEYRVLAQLLEQLIARQGWRYEPDSAARSEDIFRRYLRRNDKGTLEGNSIALRHDLPDGSDIRLVLHYNRRFSEIFPDKKMPRDLRPDFLFQVTVGGNTRNFILDAKYRRYDSMGGNYYWAVKDILGVCVDKYLVLPRRAGIEITSAFIVHNDMSAGAKYVDFGGCFNKKFDRIKNDLIEKIGSHLDHQCGAFYLTPGSEAGNLSQENLTTWFRLMFEYGFADSSTTRVCWHCGNTRLQVRTLELEGGSVKYHLLCEQCGEFWVETHCRNCSTPLFKHEFNYHSEVGDSHWHVICPKCGGRFGKSSSRY